MWEFLQVLNLIGRCVNLINVIQTIKMYLIRLNYCNKWLIKYKGKALVVGNSIDEVLGVVLFIIKNKR